MKISTSVPQTLSNVKSEVFMQSFVFNDESLTLILELLHVWKMTLLCIINQIFHWIFKYSTTLLAIGSFLEKDIFFQEYSF